MLEPGRASLAEQVAALSDVEQAEVLRASIWTSCCGIGPFGAAQRSRNHQPAQATAWNTWLILAGRGFGKTRAGAEWVRRT
jgi:hypothetical protein